MIPVELQVQFYKWQLVELSREWELYYNSHVQSLVKKHDCALGMLQGLDEVRGNIIVRFPKDTAIRLNSLYAMYYFLSPSLVGGQLTFKDFVLKNEVVGTGDNSVQSIYIMDSTDDYVDFAFSGAPSDYFDKLLSEKQKRAIVNVLIGKSEPPYRYLKRLAYFLENNSNINFLDFIPTKQLNQNTFEADRVLTIINALDNTSEIIIQGPPGTGKSTLVANILEKIATGKRICVTALTNKALVELAKKLKGSSIENLVYKTNLSMNEKKELSFLRIFDENSVPESFVQLTTYYKLSEKIVHLQSNNPIFDILIIEEASQAFFTTIQAFSLLAKKVIIIGDPNQLTPVVLNPGKRSDIHLKIDKLINGLETWMHKPNSSYYLLDETFRLNEFNTWLTNSFYGNQLKSKGSKPLDIIINDDYLHLFNVHNTTALWKLNKFSEIYDLKVFLPQMKDLIRRLSESNNVEIAVLSPYKEDVMVLQLGLSDLLVKNKGKLLVETIDRVQGMTVDIVFTLLRIGNSPQFLFDKNRLNVSTSRARHYNIIIADKNFEIFTSNISSEVKKYFNKLLSC